MNSAKRATRVSSRLAKKQRQQMAKQSVLLIIGSFAIGAVFLFFIMPNAIRLFFNFIDKDGGQGNKDILRPQIPILQAFPEATFTSKVKLNGYAEAGSEVHFVAMGKKLDKIVASEEGMFEYELKLQRGLNEVSVYSIDAAGNESISARDFTIYFDDEVPEIEITEPADEAHIELKKNQVTTIKGNTEAQSKVYIGERMVYTGSDGSFSTTYRLSEGKNELLIRVVDRAGNETEKEYTLYFKY